MDNRTAKKMEHAWKAADIDPEDFFDMVEKQKYQLDTLFSLRLWRPEPPLYPESTSSVIGKILASPRVKETIDQVAIDSGSDRAEVVAQANAILQEMGHKYYLGTVRSIGFFMAKLIRQLYEQVLINNSGLEKLKKAMSESPVLILPTHRSYADFILITYMCYSLDIPLPIIAAGMDFKGMNFIGHMLQNCGAFFIRRSFGHDRLYWAIVSEYMHYHVVNYQVPIEFFIEGTRSRNGKTLPAKTGLLTMALESYFKGDVPDIQLCTISISYERLLEESLYAYELLGIPKPKESTSGFLSGVAKIRQEKFGRIYVNISDPISVRDHLSKRPKPEWGIPSHHFSLNNDEKRQLHDLAHKLVCKQQKEVITPVSAVLFSVLSMKSCTLEQLANYLLVFNSIILKYLTHCFIKGDVRNVIISNLELHKQIVAVDSRGYYCCQQAVDKAQDIQSRAATRIAIQNYSNQILGPLINIAVYATAKKFHHEASISDRIDFFAKYLSEEFVMIRSSNEQDLNSFESVDNSALEVLSNLLRPFLETFYLVLHAITMGVLTEKEIQSKYRELATAVLMQGSSSYPEILAVDKVSRHLHNLNNHQYLLPVKNKQATCYNVRNDLSQIINELERYLDQNFVDTVKSQFGSTVHLKSNL